MDTAQSSVLVQSHFSTLPTASSSATPRSPPLAYPLLHPAGVAFKEGLCYNKWEAAGLFGALPLLLLGHLFSVLPAQGEQGMLAAVNILLTVSCTLHLRLPSV